MSTRKIELSVGATKIANKYEILTEEEIDNIDKIPELEERVDIVEDELEESLKFEVVGEGSAVPDISGVYDDTEIRGMIDTVKNKYLTGATMISHRGAWKFAPQNSRKAFEIAYSQGFKVIETDIVKTKDDNFIMFHDGVVNNILNGSGNVSELNLSAIKSMSFNSKEPNTDLFPNERVLDFAEFLTLVKGMNLNVVLEFKYYPSIDDLNVIKDMINLYDLINSFSFSAFNLDILKAVRIVFPHNLLINSINGDITEDSITDDMKKLKPFALCPYFKSLTNTGVKIANKNNIFVIPYDVNSYTEYINAITWGCVSTINDCIGGYNINGSYIL